MPLKIHLLTKNNEKTIEEAIESLLPLESEIIVADMGSHDATPSICGKRKIKVLDVRGEDYGKVRNGLLGNDWNFYIHPWEVLATGHNEIKEIANKTEAIAYNFRILQNKIVTYEIRLWRKLKFKNPIFENITYDAANLMETGIIYAVAADMEDKMEALQAWKEQEIIEPYYYEAFLLLSQRKYKEFIVVAEHYLSLDGTSKSAVMLKYYLGQVQLRIFKDTSKAVRITLSILEQKPLMAEFWCLLGDIYYHLKKYRKAQDFYENAIILGSRRLNGDLWPVEIVKYEEYPLKMIESCREIYEKTNLFGVPK